ncbi:hypothetical protein GY21_03230 [Cryobacterium roopkundense]|uniref:Uncharacterized protein n=1 Tax=Cryobacterium roopkundense TaxID=1001240 RepID=A0A099JRY0_9MICO|nr:hypothetical protein [Cryobacterium roopkundense]KGJ80123.1 hypothetical protein GY21_03230 [Cryobacterium roopkundense]MBB5641664.1 hypothetical protein [Cryobacterium roopkundense]
MNLTSSDKKWFDELVVELRMRDVFGHAIGDAVASTRELVIDTGQSAEDTFGPARAYTASLDLPRGSGRDWVTRGLWTSMCGLLAFLLFVQALGAWIQDEPLLITPAQLVLAAGLGGLVALLPLYLLAAIRRPWLLGLLIAIGAGFGFLLSALTPDTAADAWLSLDPLPWLLSSGIAMVLLSAWNTIQTLRRGTLDDITEPIPTRPSASVRGRRVFVMLTNWLFPLLATIMFCGAILLTR